MKICKTEQKDCSAMKQRTAAVELFDDCVVVIVVAGGSRIVASS